MGFIPRSATAGGGGRLRIPIDSNKNKSKGTSLSYKFNGHPSLCIAPICLRWFVWFPDWHFPHSLFLHCLSTQPSLKSPALQPTPESCDTTTFLGWQGPSRMCPGHCSRGGGWAQPLKTQTRLCQAVFWDSPTGTCVGRLFPTHNQPFLFTHESAVLHNPKHNPGWSSPVTEEISVHLRPTGFSYRERRVLAPSGPCQSCWDSLWSQEAPPTPRFVLPLKKQRKGNSCKNLLFKALEASEPTMKSLVWDFYFFLICF